MPKLTSPLDAAEYTREMLVNPEQERFVIVALMANGEPIDAEVLFVGSDTLCLVCPKTILRWVLTRKRPARGFIMLHNHPSGDPTPSPQDVAVTRRVEEAASTVGLQLVDHIVVTEHTHASLAERGVLKPWANPAIVTRS